MFVVVVTEKGGSQQRIELEAETVFIGRVHGNDIVLPRGNVSKKHASITLDGDKFRISDLGSTNGTFVNGRRIREPQAVNPGDKIYVGDFILHIELVESPGTRVPVPDTAKNPSVPVMQVVSEKAEKAPPPSKSNRPSVPPPPSTRTSERPSEKRVKVPKLSPTAPAVKTSDAPANTSRPGTPPQAPISPKRPPSATTPGSAGIKKMLKDASIKIGVSEIAEGTVALVPDKVAKLRRVVGTLVDDAAREGGLPPEHTPQSFKAEVFRTAVDLGPLSDWLADKDVMEIHVVGDRTAALRTQSGWSEVESPFSAPEDFKDVAARLTAGLEKRGHRYELEEGHAVFRLDTPNPTLIINKTWQFMPSENTPELLDDTERRVLLEAVASRAKIGILGADPAARSTVLSEVTRLIPRSAFITAVGRPLPVLSSYPKTVSIFREEMGVRDHRFAAAVDEGCNTCPDWLILAGGSWHHLPAILAAAANRSAVLAEMPLSAAGRINRALSVALVSAGLSTTPVQAALFLENAFDIIVVADLTEEGTTSIKKIIASAVSEKGTWTPKVLSSR